MANELVINMNSPLALPAHLKHLAPMASAKDLTDGVGSGFAVLKFKGKVWSVQKSDTRIPILNEEGDPRASIDLTIVKANPNVSKTFYGRGFSEGDATKPACWSNDGKAPSANVENPVCASCAQCPNNVVGSRIGDDGTKMKACSDNRRLAVVNWSYSDPEGDAPHMQLLRLPYNSMKALADMGRQLSAQGAPYTAVVVKVGFDMTKAFPLLTFQPRRWLSEQEAGIVSKLAQDSSALDSILGDVEFSAATPAGDVAATFDAEPVPEVKPKAAAPKAAAPKPAAVEDATPAPAPKPKPAAKPAPAEVEVEVEDAVPPPSAAAGDDGLGGLFDEFDD